MMFYLLGLLISITSFPLFGTSYASKAHKPYAEAFKTISTKEGGISTCSSTLIKLDGRCQLITNEHCKIAADNKSKSGLLFEDKVFELKEIKVCRDIDISILEVPEDLQKKCENNFQNIDSRLSLSSPKFENYLLPSSQAIQSKTITSKFSVSVSGAPQKGIPLTNKATFYGKKSDILFPEPSDNGKNFEYTVRLADVYLGQSGGFISFSEGENPHKPIGIITRTKLHESEARITTLDRVAECSQNPDNAPINENRSYHKQENPGLLKSPGGGQVPPGGGQVPPNSNIERFLRGELPLRGKEPHYNFEDLKLLIDQLFGLANQNGFRCHLSGEPIFPIDFDDFYSNLEGIKSEIIALSCLGTDTSRFTEERFFYHVAIHRQTTWSDSLISNPNGQISEICPHGINSFLTRSDLTPGIRSQIFSSRRLGGNYTTEKGNFNTFVGENGVFRKTNKFPEETNIEAEISDSPPVFKINTQLSNLEVQFDQSIRKLSSFLEKENFDISVKNHKSGETSQVNCTNNGFLQFTCTGENLKFTVFKNETLGGDLEVRVTEKFIDPNNQKEIFIHQFGKLPRR